MASKVLVFESDAAFADELVREFQALNCEVQVVDDGNIGLQVAAAQPPDVILLSIELPRMNGFSVCNKLKKDNALKGVPLIIMSSEATEDTFEQHRRLRTRAEDYVHKPIAFADLLARVRGFVELDGAAPASDSGAIVIDDEVEFEDDVAPQPAPVAPPPPKPREVSKASQAKDSMDLDVDQFTDDAFDRLLDAVPVSNEAPAVVPKAAPAAVATPSPALATPMPAVATPVPSSAASVPKPQPVPTPATSSSNPELERLRMELNRSKDRITSLERELADQHAEQSQGPSFTEFETISRELSQSRELVGNQEQELGRMRMEVAGLKAKLTSAASTRTSISSTEFLDLRESLNQREKENLELRDRLSKKEKELLDVRDAGLALEREKSGQADKLLALEREVLDLRMIKDRATFDRDSLEQQLEDLRRDLEAAKSDGETREKEALERETRHKEELEIVRQQVGDAVRKELGDQLRATESSLKQTHEEALRQKDAELAAALESSKAQLDSLRSDSDSVKADLEAKAVALAAQHDHAVHALNEEHESKRSALQSALDASKAENAKLQEQVRELEQQLEQGRRDRDALMAEKASLEATRRDLSAEVESLRSGVVTLTSELAAAKDQHGSEVAALNHKLQSLEAERVTHVQEIDRLGAAFRDSEAAVHDRGARIEVLQNELKQFELRAAELDANLAMQRELARKSHAKWEHDRVSLDRAKDALAAVLLQIEEVETRVG